MPALRIDIEARIAQFQDSLSKIEKQGEQVGKRLERAFSGFQSALGVAGAGLSAGAFLGFIKGGLDAASALDDLSEKTSLSVETLSQLQGLTRITGADLDQVAATAGRFARSVGEAAGGSVELVKAFADVGISVDDLKRKNFDELYIRFAKAMAEAENQQTAFAVGAKLAGRNVQEALPFYKDLASIGLEAATVTSEQAAQAEQLQNEFRKLNKAIDETQTAIASSLVPRLADIGKELTKNIQQGNAFIAILKAFGQGIGVVDTGADKFVKETDRLLALQKRIGDLESSAPPDRRNPNIQRQIDVAKVEAAQLEAALQAQRRAREQEGAPRVPAGATRTVGTSSLSTGTEPRAGSELAERERVWKQILQGEEEFERERLEAVKLFSDARNAELEAAAQQETDRWRAVWEQYDREQEEALEHGRILLEGLNAEAAKDANFARELGLTFSSAFEDAIVAGESFRDVLRGVGQDLVRLAARKAVTEPLLQAAEPFAAGIGGWLRNLIPSFDVGTPFVPQDTLAFVHKGERIVPAAQNTPGAIGGPVFNVDMRGASVEAVHELRGFVLQLNGSFNERAVAAVAGARARGRDV